MLTIYKKIIIRCRRRFFAIMPVSSVEHVRQAVSKRLEKWSDSSPISLYETILIRDGMYAGRKFLWQGYQVIWLTDEPYIRFYGPCGDLLSSDLLASLLPASDQASTKRIAA